MGGRCLFFAVLFLIAVLLAPSWGVAAGFDCSTARTKLEKMICRDPELSDADDRLSRLYRQRIQKTKDKEALIQSQREWIKRRNGIRESDVLLKMYRDRLLELGDPVIIKADSIRSTCDLFLRYSGFDKSDVTECKVSKTGVIGSINNLTYHYALYCLVPESPGEERTCTPDSHYDKRGLSVFVQDDSSTSLRFLLGRGSYEIGVYTYNEPKIVTNQYGKFLYLPVQIDGTGNGNDSDYYIWDNWGKGWKALDSRLWLDDLRKYIPKGSYVGSGVWPDLSTMTAEIYLYRDNDANCCPSGGIALVALSVHEGRFQIKSVKISKSDE